MGKWWQQQNLFTEKAMIIKGGGASMMLPLGAKRAANQTKMWDA
jgi:hypothetical protein